MRDSSLGKLLVVLITLMSASTLASLSNCQADPELKPVATDLPECPVQPMLGPGYVDNVEDIACSDAGTLISSPSAISWDCECTAAVNWGSEPVIPLTGRSETNFNVNARSFSCRSQANAVCDCWALTSSPPTG